jgi:hypothetical protein
VRPSQANPGVAKEPGKRARDLKGGKVKEQTAAIEIGNGWRVDAGISGYGKPAVRLSKDGEPQCYLVNDDDLQWWDIMAYPEPASGPMGAEPGFRRMRFQRPSAAGLRDDANEEAA